MLGLVLGSELLQNIALVNLKFFGSMCKREEVGVAGEIKHDGPVPMGRDRFRNVLCPEFKLDFTDRFGALIVGGGRVEPGEYVVKVNGFTLDKIEPFGVGKGWASRGIDDARLDLLGVD